MSSNLLSRKNGINIMRTQKVYNNATFCAHGSYKNGRLKCYRYCMDDCIKRHCYRQILSEMNWFVVECQHGIGHAIQASFYRSTRTANLHVFTSLPNAQLISCMSHPYGKDNAELICIRCLFCTIAAM